jgi:UDP-N-acetylmuramate: L-alanyl-gamma-D-glutamyl-meso-diaminopimelate ligase
MHIHILGICGTFMGSLAQLIKQQGHKVTGSDASIYPPMSDQLIQAGIELIDGYDPSQLDPSPDCIIVGNALGRGNPCVEYMLNRGLSYTSGPQWLGENILSDKWVIAVSGTHGKTTTASMLAWILECEGLNPSYLIGGVPQNLSASARLTDSSFFVIEADEYDTAFFDKRSKFIHYHINTLVINNLEFDHSDIFDSLADIEKQFHHVVRTIPSVGYVLYPAQNKSIQGVLAQGCWSELQSMGVVVDKTRQFDWQVQLLSPDGKSFEVTGDDNKWYRIEWSLIGQHNVENALSAIAAAKSVGVNVDRSAVHLSKFLSVKRRMELVGDVGGIRVYDDFAHHPTAILATLSGIKKNQNIPDNTLSVPRKRIIAVLELRSNTMKGGVHKDALIESASDADLVYWVQSSVEWSLEDIIKHSNVTNQKVFSDSSNVLTELLGELKSGDDVIVMSNGGFDGMHKKLLAALEVRYSSDQ